MVCGRFKRVRQLEATSGEVEAFKRKLKLTILLTLVSEKNHSHDETEHTAHALGDMPVLALSAAPVEVDPLSRLRHPEQAKRRNA